MSYCERCGREIEGNDILCPECVVDFAANAPKISKKNAVISFVLALINVELVILAIMPYLCFAFFPACLVLSIIGIKKSNQFYKETGLKNAFSIIGKVVSIVTLVLACVFFLLGLIMSLVPGAADAFYEAFLATYGIGR